MRLGLSPSSVACGIVVIWSVTQPGHAAVACDSSSEDQTTVVLALDGVPYSVIGLAREQGAFDGWQTQRPLVATFPSMTNVSFSAILQPLDVGPVAGYEIPHFDRDRNRMVGKLPFGAKKRAYAWRDVVEKERQGSWKHAMGYLTPRRLAFAELAQMEETVLASDQDFLVVYLARTDSLTHLHGYQSTLRFLLELDPRLEALQEQYRQQTSRCLRLVLLSDHGNTDEKVRRAKGLKRQLRRSGFNLRSRLEGPNDAVAPTFGLVNFGAIYVQDRRARDAAESIAAHPNVELAAFVSGSQEVTVLAGEASARLGWRETPDGPRYSYEPTGGDPLALSTAVSRLRATGALDDDGFAKSEDWLVHSIEAPYPNAPKRIIDSLTGTYVKHAASVLFSIEPGYAWGRKAAYLVARIKGGLLEGTHGGLDSLSSSGFFLVNDAALDPGRPVSSSDALSFLTTERSVPAVASE